MIDCHLVEDTGAVIAHLRQDVLRNNRLIQSLERTIPAVPCEVWAARRADGTIVGVMLAEKFPERPTVSLQADFPEAVTAMLGCLKPEQRCNFWIHRHLWEHLEPQLADVTRPTEYIAMALSSDDLRMFASASETRRLCGLDRESAKRFPFPPWGLPERRLSYFVEVAEHNPQTQIIWGVLLEGEIVSYVRVEWVIDNIWEVDAIETREEHKRKGIAKAVLSHASGELAPQRIALLWRMRSDNIPAVRTAQAVGFREAYRLVRCQACSAVS